MIAKAASEMGRAATRTAPRAVVPWRPQMKLIATISPGTTTNLASRYSAAWVAHRTACSTPGRGGDPAQGVNAFHTTQHNHREEICT